MAGRDHPCRLKPRGHETIGGLTRVLARVSRQLAHAGQPEEAGRLAADGWTLLRHTHPVQAQRLDGTMHHVALLESKPEKTKQLIAVAVAHVTQCPYCINGHTKLALRKGNTPEEIMEAIWVAAEMRAGGAFAHSTLALDAIEAAQPHVTT